MNDIDKISCYEPGVTRKKSQQQTCINNKFISEKNINLKEKLKNNLCLQIPEIQIKI
jgi:hypothetical protein